MYHMYPRVNYSLEPSLRVQIPLSWVPVGVLSLSCPDIAVASTVTESTRVRGVEVQFPSCQRLTFSVLLPSPL